MDAGQINRMLYHLFANYDYRLHNSFVYSWESDFFAMSGSGYCIEVEVKVSRGDYFRDFDKEKHLLFKALQAKRSHYITHFSTHGDHIGKVRVGKLAGVRDWSRPGQRGWWSEKHNGKYGYWVNDNNNAYIQWSWQDLYAPASGFHIHKIENRKCPNQLYFACPTGLIKPDEIPAYAGLIYCGQDATYVKRAPYLHKNKQNMNAELLNKFYNLWQYKTTIEQKIQLSRQIDIFHSTLNPKYEP